MRLFGEGESNGRSNPKNVTARGRRAGERACTRLGGDSADSDRTGSKRGGDWRQCGAAYDLSQTRSISPAERAQCSAGEAELLQDVSTGGRRGGVVVCDDGYRAGGDAASAGVAAARGQSCDRKYRLGKLSHRVLPDLRL